MKRISICLLILAWSESWGQTAGDHTTAWQLYQKSLDKRTLIREAIIAGRQALDLAHSIDNDTISLLTQVQLGILYWGDGQFDQSLAKLHTAQRLGESLNREHEVAQSIHYQGLLFYYRCAFDSALRLYAAAEDRYKTLQDDSAVAKIKSHKGIIYNVQGNYELAIENMVESFRLQEKMPGYRDMSVPLQFPTAEASRMYYRSKLAKDLESLQFLNKGNSENQAFTLHNIGKDYLFLNDFENAVIYFKKSTNAYRRLGQLPFTSDLAAAYAGLGRYDSAEYWYNNKRAELRVSGTKIHLAAIETQIGGFYMTQKRWRDALEAYDSAIAMNARIGLVRAEATCRKARALTLIELNRYTEALEEIDKSLTIARQIKCLQDEFEFLKVKSSVLKKLSRHEEALETAYESNSLRDSINDGESQLQTARLQVEYDSEKKSRDLAGLQAQNEIKEAELQNKNLLLLLGVFLIAMITALIVFVFWRYKQKAKGARELELKNELIGEKNLLLTEQARQKEALLHEIHHRVKNNLQIISSLINLKSRQASIETSLALQQLGNRIFTMGLIHEKLYQSEDLQVVRLDTYLSEVGTNLIESIQDNERPVRLHMQCESVEVEVDKALTCGLICNELLTNSLKHAFTGDQAHRDVIIEIKKESDRISWTLSDNGQRHVPHSNGQSSSFGLRFVEQLVASKLAGSFVAESNNGFRVNISFSAHRNGKD